MTSSIAKKIFAAGSALAMAATAMPALAAAHSVGQNVSTPDGTVWMIFQGQSGVCRRAYTSAGAFLSYGFNSWSQVVAANSDDTALPVCSEGFIAPQDGSIIFSDRGSDKGTGYVVSGGMKYGFPTEAVFKGQGYSYSTAMWADVSWMSMGGVINSADAAHLPGVLVNNGGTVQFVASAGLWGFPGLPEFNSFGYSFAKVVPANAADKLKTQVGVVSLRQPGQLNPGSGSTITPTPAVGAVSATLSQSNPAAGVIVSGQATAPLLAIALTGNGTVNSLMLKRSGISDQNTLTNVYLYDGASRLTDGYSFNSTGDLTVNNLGLVVSGSRTIWVLADVASGLTSGTIAVGLSSVTAAGSSASPVNVMGNTMSIAAGSSLASAYLGANSLASTTPTVNAGLTNYVFWSAPLQVNTRTLHLKAANFRMIGSAPTDALTNIKMFVDGVDTGVAGAITMANGSNYVSFNFMGTPKAMQTGSHTVDLRADIQKGSSRTVQFSIQNASDLMIFDPQVGVNLAVAGPAGVAFTANSGANVTIGTGSITAVLDPSFQALTNVTGGASNVNIGKYKLHAYGEDVKIQSLQVLPVTTFPSTTYSSGTVTAGSQSITVASTTGFAVGNVITIAGATQAVGTITSITSGTVFVVNITTAGVTPAGAVTIQYASGGLQNVTLYFNGSQVGSQQNWTSGNLTFNLGSQLIVPAGTDGTLEVRSDIRTSSGNNYTGGSISANLVVGSSNATGQNSQNALSTPALTGNILTVQTGLLSVGKNTGYASQNANPNTAGVKIGSFTLQNQSSSESVRVTNFNVNVAYTGTGSTNLSGLRTSEASGSGSIPQQPATAAAASNATNSYSVDFVLAPGATKVVDIFADSSTATSATVITSLTVSSIGVTSNVNSTSSAVTGQTITFAVGTMATPTILTASSTVAQYVAAGSGGATAGSQATYNFVSTGGVSTITELTFSVSGSATAPVTSVTVGDITAPVVGTTAYMTGLSLAVPNGGSGLNVPVLLNYSEVGINGVVPNTTSILTLTTIKSTSGGTTTSSTVSVAAPTMTLVGSKPAAVISQSSPASGLNLGAENKIGEVTVTADAKGNIKLNDIQFSVASSNFSTIPTFTLARIADGTTTIAGSSCGQGTAAAASQTIFCEFGTSGNTFTTTTATTGVEVNTDFDGYTVTAGTSKTFSLYATVSAANTGTGVATISTSVVAAGFNWDDTSYATFVADGSAASPSGGTNLTGTLIYNFPTNSYTIRQ